MVKHSRQSKASRHLKSCKGRRARTHVKSLVCTHIQTPIAIGIKRRTRGCRHHSAYMIPLTVTGHARVLSRSSHGPGETIRNDDSCASAKVPARKVTEHAHLLRTGFGHQQTKRSRAKQDCEQRISSSHQQSPIVTEKRGRGGICCCMCMCLQA